MKRSGIFFNKPDQLHLGLEALKSMFESEVRTATEVALMNIVDDHTPEVVRFAQEKARWQDITGMARAFLHAKSFHEPSRHTIVLYHQVSYGPYLEINWNGRWGIILLTIEVMGEELMKKLVGILKQIEPPEVGGLLTPKGIVTG